MDSDVKDILNKLQINQEDISKTMNEINITLARQEESLRLHVYRTNLLESSVSLLRDEFKMKEEAVAAQLKPIQTHIDMIGGVIKFITIAATVLAAVGGLAGLGKFLKMF